MQALREIRKQRGLSVRRLAKLAGINHSTLVHIENGKQSPNVTTLEKLADAMDCEVGDFFPKQQPSLFEAPGQWGAGEPWGTPPPASLEQGGPEQRYGRLGGKTIKVPTPEGFVPDAMPRYSGGFISDARPYFVKVERGEMTAEEAIQELEREYATQ